MRLLRGLCPASDAFFLRAMYICYLDESGTREQTGNSSHFVLLGLAIPADTWKVKDTEVNDINKRPFLDSKRCPGLKGAALSWASAR